MKTRVLLCEGYEDRAFLDGWLRREGWVSSKGDPSPDELGKPPPGTYRYRRGDVLLRVTPVDGRDNLLPGARLLLKQQPTRPGFDRLVLCLDPDTTPGDPGADLVRALTTEFPGADVGRISWSSAGCAPGFPADHQSLERVVTSVLATLFPDRADAVRTWLAQGPPVAVHKQHARSWHARWHADQGCEAFYTLLWNDSAAAAHVRAALPAAAAELERLAGAP